MQTLFSILRWQPDPFWISAGQKHAGWFAPACVGRNGFGGAAIQRDMLMFRRPAMNGVKIPLFVMTLLAAMLCGFGLIFLVL